MPLKNGYWVQHDFPAVLRVLERERRPGEPVVVALNAVPCVRYYHHGKDAGFRYVPTVAGTLAQQGFERTDVYPTVTESGGRWWILPTSGNAVEFSVDPTLDHGSEIRLVAEAGGDPEFGIAQLFVVTDTVDGVNR